MKYNDIVQHRVESNRNRIGVGKTGFDRIEQDRTGYDRMGQNRTG